MWPEASSVLHELRWRKQISDELATIALDRLVDLPCTKSNCPRLGTDLLTRLLPSRDYCQHHRRGQARLLLRPTMRQAPLLVSRQTCPRHMWSKPTGCRCGWNFSRAVTPQFAQGQGAFQTADRSPHPTRLPVYLSRQTFPLSRAT
jgi:hypothetical protein